MLCNKTVLRAWESCNKENHFLLQSALSLFILYLFHSALIQSSIFCCETIRAMFIFLFLALPSPSSRFLISIFLFFLVGGGTVCDWLHDREPVYHSFASNAMEAKGKISRVSTLLIRYAVCIKHFPDMIKKLSYMNAIDLMQLALDF